MLGIFKKFWHRTEESNVVTVPSPSPSPFARPAAPSAPAAPAVRRAAPAPVTHSAPRPAATLRPASPVVSVTARASTLSVPSVPGSITVTLGSIEQSLPEPLRHKIAGALHELVPVPINKVLPQLYRGSVSVTVKELREYAPELLASFHGHDDIPVTLPLADVLRQIDPKLLPRRGSQKRIEVPNEVAPIFTQTSDGMTVIAQPPAAVPQTPRPAPGVVRPATATATIPIPAAAPVEAPARAERISLSPQALAALAAAAPKKTAPAKAPAVAIPIPEAAVPIAAPHLPHLPSAATSTARPAAVPVATIPSFQKPTAPIGPVSMKGSAVLPMPLDKLAPVLPPEICKELGDVDVSATSISLPMAQVESMLKSGKVLFTWGDITSWLTPPLPRPPSNSAASLLIELPLKIIAPVFMAHHRAGGAQKRADVGEGIPDLFQSADGAAEPSARVKPAQPTPAPAQPTPAAPAKKSAKATQAAQPEQPVYPPIEALLGTSAGRFSPKEIIQNISKLPGLSGALLAMTDGLPIASVMPQGLKADTMAAFLPQMYGRMTQYTKELGLGGLQSMTLNVEGGSSWHVFKQPNIYFAACGKSGEPMPVNLLAQIAAELSKQPM